jgi:hypothetical protein
VKLSEALLLVVERTGFANDKQRRDVVAAIGKAAPILDAPPAAEAKTKEGK